MSEGNKPAFPNVKYNKRENPDPGAYEYYLYDTSLGLTKREYFAGLALQGALANQTAVERVWQNAKELNPDSEQAGIACEQCIAEVAVHMADALIRALKEGGE